MIDAEIDALAQQLRPHYRHFLADKQGLVLLTGHSHQAWPDVCRQAQLQAFDDAAQLVDEKWSKIFGEILPDFQARVAARLGSQRASDLAIAPNTHELGYRLHSCFPGAKAVVTSDGEFHSLRRQLGRLTEDGLHWEQVPVGDGTGYGERFLAAVDRVKPAWCAFSWVLFGSGRLLPDAERILVGLSERRVPVLVDVYHAFNVLELSVDRWPGQVFVTGGGYKYAASGEGCCWMLLPADAAPFRPQQTGWFADFAHLESSAKTIEYGAGGARFFGSTFDPTPFYRGQAALRFFDEQGLTPTLLAQAAQRSTGRIIELWRARNLAARGLGLLSPERPEERGGFVSFTHKDAAALKSSLRARGVLTDHRGEILRLGPAPYTTAEELHRAMMTLESLL